jgi:hypothetical protein
MSMSTRRALSIERIAQRADAYGMPGVTVDGNDVLQAPLAPRLPGDVNTGNCGRAQWLSETHRALQQRCDWQWITACAASAPRPRE